MGPILFADGLVGSYYRSPNPNGTLVIVAIGAPNLVDVDSLRNAPILTDAGYDVVTPEYYGFCRSAGEFTPLNSVRTLVETKRAFSGGTVTDIYSGEAIPVAYSRFVFLGLSYGGGVVPLLPRFDPTIDTLACFYPVTDYSTFGTRGVKEETVEDFLGALRRWFATQYRGIERPEWTEHFADRSDLIPARSLDDLAEARIFLAHGTTDDSIYYRKTREYADALKKKFPTNDIVYREYEGKWHGTETMVPATRDLVAWLATLPERGR